MFWHSSTAINKVSKDAVSKFDRNKTFSLLAKHKLLG
jgi:hypothetical protein